MAGNGNEKNGRMFRVIVNTIQAIIALGVVGLFGLAYTWGGNEMAQNSRLDLLQKRLAGVETYCQKLDSLSDKLERKMAADSAQSVLLNRLLELLRSRVGDPIPLNRRTTSASGTSG
jgi:hypothetical protein